MRTCRTHALRDLHKGFSKLSSCIAKNTTNVFAEADCESPELSLIFILRGKSMGKSVKCKE